MLFRSICFLVTRSIDLIVASEKQIDSASFVFSAVTNFIDVLCSLLVNAVETIKHGLLNVGGVYGVISLI